MEDSRNDLVSQVRQLQLDLADIRTRVLALERGSTHELIEEVVSGPLPSVTNSAEEEHRSIEAEALAPLFGWAFLGLSIAYLLRAATESGTIPLLAGVIAGIFYAGGWIFLAGRRAWQNPVASTVYSVTAALIVAPLL
jgi:hypothetical protein